MAVCPLSHDVVGTAPAPSVATPDTSPSLISDALGYPLDPGSRLTSGVPLAAPLDFDMTPVSLEEPVLSTGASGVTHGVAGGWCLEASSSFLEGDNALVLEAHAIREALLRAEILNLSQFVIESDCKVLVDALVSSSAAPWRIHTLVADILLLQSRSNYTKFIFCRREGNKTADWVANQARALKDRFVWPSVQPPELENLLTPDILGLSA
ncbi:hypothetical protein Cni_G13515 [Canna indica]|uniref:RNase H type-1 domain-containing protein n=1 Tax=Canna indica TaxID=4628 RepID=A0AAQ3KCR8_9LILI|nr:hypothetical protein Cni_G13515 [Canna indica]